MAVLILLAALGRATPQFDAAAPEPLVPLRGALVLAGDGEPPPEALACFLALAPEGRPALLLCSGEVPPALARTLGPRVTTRGVAGGTPEALARAVRGSAAVWLAGDEATWSPLLAPEGALARALAELIEEGGVAGASGACARLFDAEDAGLLAGYVLLGEHEDAEPHLARAPGVPVLEVPEGGTVLARGRELAFLGSPGRVLLAGADARRLPGIWLEPGRCFDRLALSRAAADRAAPDGAPGSPHVPAGALFLAGGGALPPGALERFVEAAGGPDAPLVYLPARAGEAGAGEPPFVRALRAAGARDVCALEPSGRDAADHDPRALAALRGARGVWVGGGRAHLLIDAYQHTEVHRLLHAVLARGGAVGGSSAGASVLAATLVRGGPLKSRDVLAAGYERGFGLLPGTAIDQHFSERARFPDLLALKRARPELLAIGIDEGTLLVVRGAVGEILGAGRVTFLDSPGAPASPEEGATRAAAGERYDLVLRRPVP